MRFEFATANRVLFGPGTLREAGAAAAALGRHALVVAGAHPERAAPLLEILAAAGVGSDCFPVAGEPTTDTVRAGVARAREEGADLVIGFGGGSALDAAKAIAVLLTNRGDPLEYLEVVGRGQPLAEASAPCIAIPTTAGTGTEVTRNAVLASPEHRVKASLRSPTMLPRLAIVDPELTYALPPAVTASTGLDALTQLIEPFVSSRANPLVDALCREGLARAARSLRRAFEEGHDKAAREEMALAALLGGLALANAGLGAVHGFAGPLGGMFPAPHGAVCARLLPLVMEVNVRALQERRPDSPVLRRYDEVGRIPTGRPAAGAGEGAAWVAELVDALSIPPLSAYGMRAADVPALVEKGAAASSMKGNPLPLTPAEMAEVLARAL